MYRMSYHIAACVTKTLNTNVSIAKAIFSAPDVSSMPLIKPYYRYPRYYFTYIFFCFLSRTVHNKEPDYKEHRSIDFRPPKKKRQQGAKEGNLL